MVGCCLLAGGQLLLWAGDDRMVVRDSVRILFPVNVDSIIGSFEGNDARMAATLEHIRTTAADTTCAIGGITIYAMASPEGRPVQNEILARQRAEATAAWLQGFPPAASLSYTIEYAQENWDYLHELLDASGWPLREKAWHLADSLRNDRALAAADPAIRAELLRRFYPRMRTALVVFDYEIHTPLASEPVTEPAPVEAQVPVQETVWEPVPVPELPSAMDEPRSLGWYIKTNFLTWPLNLLPDVAAEWELGHHLSVSIPVYWSCLDWFHYDKKFRVLGTQPELRWWLSDEYLGPFAALHLTFGWYNIATGGSYRYQDHRTDSPSLGGGLTAGWRIPLSRKEDGVARWSLEFTAGIGLLPLYYDTFYNLPNGALADEGLRKTYWGVDNAAVTLSYRFGRRAGK